MFSRSSSSRWAIVAALFAAACSTQENQREESAQTPPEEETADVDTYRHSDVVIPPQEYYDALLAKQLSDPDSLSLDSEPQVLWLNFNGASLTKGFGSGQSFILCNSSATIPSSGIGSSDQAIIVEAAKDHFRKANSRIRIVLDRPASGDFTTMHVGGSFADLGCSGNGVLGVAPLDKDNRNRNDVAFTFLISGKNPKIVSDTIAHETAHSLGLQHTTKTEDLMYPQAQHSLQKFAVSPLENGQIQDGPAILKSVLGFECPVAPSLPEPASVI